MQSDEIKEFRKTANQIKFPSQGLTLYGWMYRPPGEGPFPAIVWNHGSEKSPGAHPELGKFYTDHGYVLFLPVRHGHGRSPGQYIGNALDDYKELVTDKKLIQKKAVDLQDAYNADVVAAVVWLRHQKPAKLYPAFGTTPARRALRFRHLGRRHCHLGTRCA